MSTNRISTSIPDDVITEVTTGLNRIKTLLQPYLQSLTKSERHDLPKMSDGSLSFVSKANEYCSTNPEFCPPYLDAGEFDKDFIMNAALKPVLDFCEQLCSNVDDTRILTGNESYMAALLYYGSVQIAARTGQANAKPIYDDLRARFPGRKRKQVEAPVV